MSDLRELTNFIKNQLAVRREDLNDLTPREMDIWQGRKYSDITTIPPRVASRMLEKLPIIAIRAGLRASTGLQKKQNIIILQFLLIKILVTFSAIKLYTRLAEKLIVKCVKYSMVWEGCYLSRILYYVYSTMENDNKKLAKYTSMREMFNKEYEIEQLAEKYYCEIMSFYKKKKFHQNHVIKMAQKYDEELMELKSEINNPLFITIKYLLRLTLSESVGDMKSYLETCNEALELFEKNPIDDIQGERIFITKKLVALTILKEYQSLELYMLETENKFRVNSLVWIHFLERRIISSLRQLKVQEAAATIKKLNSSVIRAQSSSEASDRIDLYQLYINILGKRYAKIQIIQVALDLPRFSSDLKGMNVCLLIAELVHSAMLQDFDYISSRQDAIKNYIDKHARYNDRSKWFIRILINLPLSQIDWHKWFRLHNRMYGKMNNNSDSVENIELVEYDRLFRLTCDRALVKNKRYLSYIDNSIPNQYKIAGID